MPHYAIVYFGGDQPQSKEEGEKHFAHYQQWLTSLGEAVVEPMNPLKNTQSLAPDGAITSGSQVAMSGYTLVAAPDMDAALAMAKRCPFLAINGRLEVSELVVMS